MKTMRTVAFLCALLPATQALAQEEPGTIARVTYWKISAGMESQFEEGLQRHNNLHKNHNDPWSLHTWQVVSGERAGQYIRATFGHHWADFDAEDAMAEADAADVAVNLDPYIEAEESSHYATLPELSRPPGGDSPQALVRVLVFHLHPGKAFEFAQTVGKIHQAIVQTDWPSNYIWYELEDGGHVPTYVVTLPRDSWAGFADPEPSMVEMLNGVYGEEGTRELIDSIARTVKHEYAYTAAYRADLSYAPATE